MADEKNKRLSEFEVLMADVKGLHSKRINAMLITQDEEEFAVNYFKILEYASPKLQRSEIVAEAVDQKIILEHTYRPSPESDKVEEEKK